MSRILANLWIDLAALVSMLGLAVTGAIIRFVLPAGTGHFLELFGLNRHEYGTLHFWFAVATVVLVMLHLALHWTLVCCTVAQRIGKPRPSRTTVRAWGAWLVVVALGLPIAAVLWSASSVRKTSANHSGYGRHTTADTPSVRSPSSQSPKAFDPLALPPAPPAALAATPPTRHASEPNESCDRASRLNGRSTLLEAASAAELTVDALSAQLGIAPTPDARITLGRLRKTHGISVHDVRAFICRRR